MLASFYKWLYHKRRQSSARNRLAGKPQRSSLFKRFERSTVDRESFGKYETALFKRKRLYAVLFLPLTGFALWFIFESAQALSIFQ